MLLPLRIVMLLRWERGLTAARFESDAANPPTHPPSLAPKYMHQRPIYFGVQLVCLGAFVRVCVWPFDVAPDIYIDRLADGTESNYALGCGAAAPTARIF